MAKEHPRYAQTEWPEWEFQEFPMMVYPGAPNPAKPYGENGKPLPGVIVQNAEEADAVLGIEREEPEPAPKVEKPARLVPGVAKGTQRVANADDDKAELLAEAERLGVKVDKSWSLARLQDAIDTHKNEVM